ncbi:MAG: histidinol-phosphate transaminase [Acidobacteriota bacterium]
MNKKDPLRGVKSQVLEVPAYSLHAFEAEIKLNQNENPFDFPEDLKEEVFRRFKAREWSRYPDFVPDSVRKSLADFAGWRKDGVLVGNGSNELLQATLMVLVGNGTKVVIPSPTYNVNELISKSESSEAGVLIINTPNNPTGSVIRNDDLQRILDEFSGHVLLDEAYFEFWGHSGLELLDRYPRLIITRTFSKAMGMAGLRVGYLLGHEDLVSQISKAKLPDNVNQFSLTASEVAVENKDRFRTTIENVLKERDRLGKELGDIPGICVYPSEANFFLVGVPFEPKIIFDDLYRQGILIRDVSSYPMLSKCLRISIGTREQNDRLLSALRTGMESRMPGGSAGARGSK